jgi:hypothetical protein
MYKRLLPILVVFVLLASTLVGCSDAPSTSSTLTVLSITDGNVFVMKAGTDDWTEATVEMSLEVGDTIKTGDDSGAEITFFDGSTIELEAGTQIEITSLDSSPDTGTKTITLMQTIGTTISRVTKLLDPASTYAIETPSGVAAVRGSRLIVRIVFDDPNYEDGTVLMTCVEGDIWVVWNGVELRIPEGYTCVIRPDGVLELIPSSELPQEEGGGVPNEGNTNEQSEEPQPGTSATDNSTEPAALWPEEPDRPDLPNLFPPPSGGSSDDGGGSPDGGGSSSNDSETTGTIHVTTPATGPLVFIKDETGEWAINQNNLEEVDGKNYGQSSQSITLLAGHHYYVWVEGAGGTTYNVDNSHGWSITPAPNGGQQADGDLGSGQQNLKFNETG